MFEERMLRIIFGPTSGEVPKGWIDLHNKEFHGFYFSPNIWMMKSRNRWAGHVARMGKMRKVSKISVSKPEGERPLRSPRRKWEDNIKMNIRKDRFGGVDWIHVAHDTDRWQVTMKTEMNLRVS
jgi:hypothetical protein